MLGKSERMAANVYSSNQNITLGNSGNSSHTLRAAAVTNTNPTLTHSNLSKSSQKLGLKHT